MSAALRNRSVSQGRCALLPSKRNVGQVKLFVELFDSLDATGYTYCSPKNQQDTESDAAKGKSVSS